LGSYNLGPDERIDQGKSFDSILAGVKEAILKKSRKKNLVCDSAEFGVFEKASRKTKTIDSDFKNSISSRNQVDYKLQR
jgi:hypothetical protein